MAEGARTHDQVFQAWKADGFGAMTWREYWRLTCIQEVQFMLGLGFRLFSLPHHSKRPYPGYDWSRKRETPEELVVNLVNSRGNIAVIAGLSTPPLVVLDWDSDGLPEGGEGWPGLTLTQRTARGWQFFTRGPFSTRAWGRLHRRYPDFDTPRAGVMYSLVPFSMTCRNDSKGGCPPKCVHDWRVREWVDAETKVVKFSEFVKAVA